MDEEVFRLVATGLLALIVLLLLLTLARVSKIQRGPVAASGQETGTTEEGRDEPEPAQETAPETEAVSLPTTTPETEATPVGAADPVAAAEPVDEGPYERDGRWWFRRDGDLLVYDERREEWVDPSSTADPVAEQGDSAPVQPVPVTTEPTSPEPVVAGTPAEPEPALHPLEEARGWDTAPVDATQAPIPEPVSPPQPITEVEERRDDAPQAETESSVGHWKCPACGVINGSTATSCRMCFSARP